MNRCVLALAVAASLLAGCGAASAERVVVAAGTTLVDSGFLTEVVDRYRDEHPEVTVAIVALSSAEAFAYGEAGSADVLITHEPAGLATFLDRHPEAQSSVVFSSDFLVAAPPGARVPTGSVVEVFDAVARRSLPFVSRDDGSGTNARERSVWAAVGTDPTGESWYIQTGAGMLSSLLIASDRAAVTLAERGAFLAAAPRMALREVPLESAELLDNPYDLTVVDGEEAANDLARWLLGDDGRAAIRSANDVQFGSQVYRLP